jgi:hypothetical protein
VDEVSCFLLSGRAWVVVRVQHADRQVIVEAAPRGRQPTWGGFLRQFLSHALCQRILAVLTSTEDCPYLSQPARDALALKRDEVHDILEPCICGVEVDAGEIRWWTYAGGTINSTLRHAIAAIEPDWKITADNVLVGLRGEGSTADISARHWGNSAVPDSGKIPSFGRTGHQPESSGLSPEQVPATDAVLGGARGAGALSPRLGGNAGLARPDGVILRHKANTGNPHTNGVGCAEPREAQPTVGASCASYRQHNLRVWHFAEIA